MATVDDLATWQQFPEASFPFHRLRKAQHKNTNQVGLTFAREAMNRSLGTTRKDFK
jgi:hypothetical protein